MNDWQLLEETFDPAYLHRQETVFTLGNGYLGARGAFEEGYPGAWPATLIHGVYDAAPIVYTELANCPDWLSMYVFVDGERFGLDRGDILHYERRLDLQRGVLWRSVRWRSPAGRTLDLTFERFASLADEHVLAIRCQVTPLDGPCDCEVHAGIDGHPDNQGLLHWQWLDQGGTARAAWLHTRTRQSGIELGMAFDLQAQGPTDVRISRMDCRDCPTLAATWTAAPGETAALEKRVTVFTSRDVVSPAQSAVEWLSGLSDYTNLIANHERAWQATWETSDVIIEGDETAQLAVRHSLFQILASVPRHDDRVSVSAKTLSGFGYRGHVFWDTEIFMLPFLTYTQPALARNLLTYRYHTLPGARRKARANGYEGAMYAWESADTGDEVTPRWVPGPRGEELVRIWCGDIELHITADVAYAVWHYWQATGDDEWMRCCGAEILLDTAVYWGSRAEWNAAQERYEISDVIGPDEYHEHVDNNAFTNRMIQWHLRRALQILDWLQETDPSYAQTLSAQLDLSRARLDHWRDVIARLYIPRRPDSSLIEQFEGFFDRHDIDLQAYEPRTRSMQVILGIEGANEYQVLKQADVIMLLYLLRDEYDRQTWQANWDYYVPRTDHTYGSSLGPAIHAAMAGLLGRPDEAYTHWKRAALVDLQDVRGNTNDGIHAASAGGLWQALVFGFGGVELTPSGPVAHPHLPHGWKRLRFRLHYRGRWYDLDLSPTSGSPTQAKPDIQGVIFDLDGVLTDTSEYHYLGWKRLADEEGLPFDRQANEALRGVSRRESLLLLLGGRPATEAQMEEMMARKNRYYQEFIGQATEANLLPGALDLLGDLAAAGIKVAIASASKNARTVIERLGLERWVDAISDGYSVMQTKPAPDLFLHAAAQLGLAPDQCVVVEDAASGVQAALAGGMWAVGLGPAERVGAAHVVLPSLADVRWAGLYDRLIRRIRQDCCKVP